MGVSLPTDTAIVILATIAAVYFAITAVLFICVCCCICNKKKCRARVKPVRDAYSPRHSKVYNDKVYTDSTSFTSRFGTSVATEASSDVSGGLVLKNRSVVKRAKKKTDPYSEQEWQGGRDSAILTGVLTTNTDQLSDEGTSSSGSTNETEKMDTPTTTDIQTRSECTELSKKDLSAGDSSMDQSVDRGNDVSQTGENDDDNVFEDSTTVKANEGEQTETAVRPTFEERKQKKIAQKKKKREVFRTDSTKPLLNGSESRTQSETSDIGYEVPPYRDQGGTRPLTPMQEDQPSQTPSLTPLKITARQNLTPINAASKVNSSSPVWVAPSNYHSPSSIVRGRPVLPKIGQSTTPIKVEPANDPMVEDVEDEEDNNLSML